MIKENGPASCVNNQQDLFNHNVIAHAVAEATSLCSNPLVEIKRNTMKARQQKAIAIAASSNVSSNGHTWIIPSQTSGKKYTVTLGLNISTCTCPDFETRHQACKHIFAAQLLDHQKQTGEALPTPEPVKRPTYPQQWHEYNLSQTREKAYFQNLLYQLCDGLDKPIRKSGPGRPSAKISDLIFAACVKVYAGMSGRRNQTDLREAFRRGFLSHEVHYNTVFKYLELESLTPYLQELITETSAALKNVEVDFAVDSSGFSTCQYVRWFDVKHGGKEDWHDWIKLHLMTGVKTNIVTSCEVSRRYANDSPYFKPLLEATYKSGFQMREVSADKGYISSNNIRLSLVKGIDPYIPFKTNHTTNQKSTVWNRMLNFYRYHQEEFNAHYHKRSNVESTFSMIKARFGERLRSKTERAQINEALVKVLCHNICVVIQSMHELGLEVEFMGRMDECL
jgi:transposase